MDVRDGGESVSGFDQVFSTRVATSWIPSSKSARDGRTEGLEVGGSTWKPAVKPRPQGRR